MKTLVLGAVLAGLLTAVPAGLAGPVVCSGSCTIGAASLGFLPPVQAVESGSNVSWESIDGVPHVNQDSGVEDFCFFATMPGGGFSDPIRFDIEPDGLYAVADPGTVTETATFCANAVPAGGNFVVSYFCVLHPALMKGALVVVP